MSQENTNNNMTHEKIQKHLENAQINEELESLISGSFESEIYTVKVKVKRLKYSIDEVYVIAGSKQDAEQYVKELKDNPEKILQDVVESETIETICEHAEIVSDPQIETQTIDISELLGMFAGEGITPEGE